jgi:uncharacterized membrane protein
MKTMIYPVHHGEQLTSEEQELLIAVGTGISAADLLRSVSLPRHTLYSHLDKLREKGCIKTETIYAAVPA